MPRRCAATRPHVRLTVALTMTMTLASVLVERFASLLGSQL
jgi:hypothetical protein